MKLIIGNKRLSSWSLRPWVLMKHFNIPFDEILILLDQPNTKTEILKYSPSGFVPCLIDDDLVIHDSLSIAEYLYEKYPEKKLWPDDFKKRAFARSISCEMHSGFSTMRKIMSHDLQKNLTHFDCSEAQKDIDRVIEIWTEALEQSGGPFLFGEFCIADAMFAPVVNRFISYAVEYPLAVKGYVDHVRQLASHQEWIQQGLVEKHEAKFHT
jgi:glutathione S-transferase